MHITTPQIANPVERFVDCFDTVKDAASAAGVTTEQLRQLRKRGYVNTRDRAIAMAEGCNQRVTAAALLDLPRGKGRSK
jgi:hypothetical protein